MVGTDGAGDASFWWTVFVYAASKRKSGPPVGLAAAATADVNVFNLVPNRRFTLVRRFRAAELLFSIARFPREQRNTTVYRRRRYGAHRRGNLFPIPCRWFRTTRPRNGEVYLRAGCLLPFTLFQSFLFKLFTHARTIWMCLCIFYFTRYIRAKLRGNALFENGIQRNWLPGGLPTFCPGCRRLLSFD